MAWLPNIALACTAAVVLATIAGPAAAESVVGRVDVAGPPIAGVPVSAAGKNVSGVRFPATPRIPQTVCFTSDADGRCDFEDRLSVAYRACQDFDGDKNCEAGEPRVTGCGRAAFRPGDFSSAHPLGVILSPAFSLSCPVPSATGRIVAQYS